MRKNSYKAAFVFGACVVCVGAFLCGWGMVQALKFVGGAHEVAEAYEAFGERCAAFWARQGIR